VALRPRSSAAWARALHRAELIDQNELGALLEGLEAVGVELASSRFPFRQEFEDVHMNIERRLIELAGPVGASSTRAAHGTTRSP